METCAYCGEAIRVRKKGERLRLDDRHPTTTLPYHCKCVGKAAVY